MRASFLLRCQNLSPIFLRVQIQLMRLLVGLLVGQLLPSFFILWYDLPTNSLTNYPTNNRISWVWMRRKMGLMTMTMTGKIRYMPPPLVCLSFLWFFLRKERKYFTQYSRPQCLLPALQNQLKPDYGPFTQINMHRTLDFCPDQPRRNQMYQS